MEVRERRIRQRLKDDFPHFASRCLKIQPGESGLVPLELNPPQRYAFQQLEQMREETGLVRAIILKARKEGLSTMIGGRFFHRVTHQRGLRAFVMTHHAESTHQLFSMVRRFHENLPEMMKPHAARDSVRELFFDRLDSSYGVGTAGGKEVGRGSTPHLLHASEFGFWANAGMHQAGIMQAVPDTPGTEIIIESTANGMGNEFHGVWQDAVSGKGVYRPIFIPWFMDPRYRADGSSLIPTDEEKELARLYELDNDQLAWRRSKISSLRSVWRFMQENPATPEEAFQSGGEDPFIPASIVVPARKREVDGYGKKVIGVDPARMGDDRTAIIIRHGPKVLKLVTLEHASTMEVAGQVRELHRKYKTWRIFVDSVGLGAGVFDRLEELGLPVTEVCAGEKALTPDRFVNIRAEMWSDMRDWLDEGEIPDMDELSADLTGPSYSWDSNGRLKLESKDDMKKRGVRSPDLGDALAISIIGPQIYRGARVRVRILTS